MRTARFGHALSVVVAVMLAGCAGTGVPSPTNSATEPGASPSTSADPTVLAAPAPAGPPLRGDLVGGPSLHLGSAGHWAIGDGLAYIASLGAGVTARDLVSGEVRWQADFTHDDPWDVQPTLGLSADHKTLAALRTVDAGGAPAVNLLLLNSADGTPLAEHLITDPGGHWQIDLPGRVLAMDDATLVLADDPESGRQTAVIDLATGTVAWWVDDQAVAATSDTVVTRGAGWKRSDGTRLWQAVEPLGPLLAQSPVALVVQHDGRAGWLDPATGEVGATTEPLDGSDAPCTATVDTLVCLTDQPTGHDLATGAQLWAAPGSADAVVGWRNWLYLWHGDGRGDVLDARTGQVLVADAELPPLRYADDRGVLLDADDGYQWVAYPG